MVVVDAAVCVCAVHFFHDLVPPLLPSPHSAVRDRPTALLRHLDDSFDFLPVLDAAAAALPSPFCVIDVGSGAGFPGAALAAARPTWRITLLDSLKKRTDFCGRAAVGAGLTGVASVWARAEDAGSPTPPPATPPLRESADAVVARAVANLRVLAELCLPLVKAEGVWVAAKGPSPEAEVAAAAAAIATLGGAPPVIHRLPPLGPGLPERTLVVVRKVGATPAQFPRRAAVPTKRPL